MADEVTHTTTATTETASTTTAPAPQSSAPVITPEIQALIDAAAQKAHDAGAAAARRALEGKQKPAEPKPQPATQPAANAAGLSIADVQQMMAEQSVFDRTVGKLGLSDDAISILSALRTVEKPPNLAEWLTERAKVFAPAPGPASAATGIQPAIPTTQAKPVPPATGVAPAPVATVPSDAPDNVLEWSQGQVDDYVSKHYPMPNHPMHPANAAARKVLSQKVHQAMAKRLIAFGPSVPR